MSLGTATGRERPAQPLPDGRGSEMLHDVGGAIRIDGYRQRRDSGIHLGSNRCPESRLERTAVLQVGLAEGQR
jgi:hypothetical protein